MGKIYKLEKTHTEFRAIDVETGLVNYSSNNLRWVISNLLPSDMGDALIIIIDDSMKKEVVDWNLK